MPVVNSAGAGIFTTHTAIMGKYARHNYHASDFRRLVCFMAKELDYDDKKIAQTLGLQFVYFSSIVNLIPGLYEALEEAHGETINRAKKGRFVSRDASMTLNTSVFDLDFPDINLDFPNIIPDLL